MTNPPQTATDQASPATTLEGVRVRLVGRFASMPRRDAAAAVVRRGGVVTDDSPDWVVFGEETTTDQRIKAEVKGSGPETLTESELWSRLGVVGEGCGIQRLYTPAMLADLVGVSVAAIRRWDRRGVLQAASRLNRLAYYDFSEARVAQLLALLLESGKSLAAVDRIVDQLNAAYELLERPIMELPLAIEDGVLLVRDDGSLTETTGQRRFDFDAVPADQEQSIEESPAVLTIPLEETTAPGEGAGRQDAHELRDRGDLKGAIEAWRLGMLNSEATAEDHFTLAEWLYESGDASAARERYYAALEIDDRYIEARVSLGCVLEEQGDAELATAAFLGALEEHDDYADAHYHLARLLDCRGESETAVGHWRRFLEIAPESPWAEEARRRLNEPE